MSNVIQFPKEMMIRIVDMKARPKFTKMYPPNIKGFKIGKILQINSTGDHCRVLVMNGKSMLIMDNENIEEIKY
jgi:hypothetical protein